MNIHELSPAPNSTKRSKRVGRGVGSGLGKTSGRGQKGQNSRSGGGVRIGFEGGQMPLIRRLPRRGFNNYEFKKQYSIVNVCDLDKLEDGTVVDINLLKEKGIVRKIEKFGLKVLGNGELSKKLTVKAAVFTKTAQEKIEKVGGKIEVL